MTRTFTIGGVSVPLPEEKGLDMEYMPIGSSSRMADGSYRAQIVAGKWKAVVKWVGLTQDERTTLWGAFVARLFAQGTIVMPNGLTFVGFTDFGSWVETQWHDPYSSRVLYNISFTLVEK